ncbi:MAG: hypothetical protein AB1452_11315 [Pseudomonadota bacterium]
MRFKYLAGAVAVILMLGYLLPPVFKLQDIALGVVIIGGVTLMLVDLWQSLKSKDD